VSMGWVDPYGSGWFQIFQLIVGWVGLGKSADGLGWIGSHKMDPWTTPSQWHQTFPAKRSSARQRCLVTSDRVTVNFFVVRSKNPNKKERQSRSSAIAEGPRDASCQLKSCQLPRNSADTTYTTSPDQIDGMKLEI